MEKGLRPGVQGLYAQGLPLVPRYTTPAEEMEVLLSKPHWLVSMNCST